MSTKITCPECKHQFDVEDAISHKLENHYKEKLNSQLEKNKSEFLKKEEALKADQQKLEAEKNKQDQKLKELLSQEKQKMRASLVKEISEEKMDDFKNLEERLERQKNELSTAKKEKFEVAQQLEALKEKEAEIDQEIQRQVLEKTKSIKDDALKAEQKKHYMALKERDELVLSLRKQMEDMQRKAEQGSMQSQGEILELEVERLLSSAFPIDDIVEVKKGVNGADCLHHVKNNSGKAVGIITYETKRTKSFSENWIDKIKADMRIHKASLGVIVTETMPKDMECFGMRDGIWICSFHEIRSVASALRQTLLKVSEIQIVNEGKGEKMQILYDFLTSDEFKHQMQAIVRGFVNMKSQIDKERRAMNKQWKEREKQLELIINGATDMYGSIKGIAGTAVGNIPELEMGGEATLIEE